MHTYFAQEDFYANALFVTAVAQPDGVRLDLQVPRFMRRGFGVHSPLEIRRDDVEHVYRCGKVRGGLAVLMMRPDCGVKPTMVSWRVVELLRPSAPISHQSRSWCRDALKTRNRL